MHTTIAQSMFLWTYINVNSIEPKQLHSSAKENTHILTQHLVSNLIVNKSFSLYLWTWRISTTHLCRSLCLLYLSKSKNIYIGEQAWRWQFTSLVEYLWSLWKVFITFENNNQAEDIIQNNKIMDYDYLPFYHIPSFIDDLYL